jgi:pimeloyl-ACP methyl ester carboxylesterase
VGDGRRRRNEIPCPAPQASSDAATVVLLHGWPDSVLRYERVLPLLSDLNVVVPALLGFPFAPPLTKPGMSIGAMAEVNEAVMSRLGYPKYIVSGGDVGSGVAEALAVRASHSVSALHLTDVFYTHQFMVGDADLAPQEQAYLAASQRWQMTEGAYALEQSSKPHTLAVALGDSPAGLLAWIVEKLRAWSDCSGDVESVFPREDLLTWVTAYWVTGTIGTSFSPYAEESENGARDRDADGDDHLPERSCPAAESVRRALLRRSGLGRTPQRGTLRRVGTTATFRRRAAHRGRHSREVNT